MRLFLLYRLISHYKTWQNDAYIIIAFILSFIFMSLHSFMNFKRISNQNRFMGRSFWWQPNEDCFANGQRKMHKKAKWWWGRDRIIVPVVFYGRRKLWAAPVMKAKVNRDWTSQECTKVWDLLLRERGGVGLRKHLSWTFSPVFIFILFVMCIMYFYTKRWTFETVHECEGNTDFFLSITLSGPLN